MSQNKRGFSLIELLAAILIIGILTSIAIPNYKTITIKSQIAANMPMLRSLQYDILNFFQTHGRLPDNINQLAINMDEFTDYPDHSNAFWIRHIATNCVFIYAPHDDESHLPTIREFCADRIGDANWMLEYPLRRTNLGFEIDTPLFRITWAETSDPERMRKIARSFGWQRVNDFTYRVR